MDTTNLKTKRKRYRDLNEFGQMLYRERVRRVVGYIIVLFVMLAVITVTAGGAASWFAR